MQLKKDLHRNKIITIRKPRIMSYFQVGQFFLYRPPCSNQDLLCVVIERSNSGDTKFFNLTLNKLERIYSLDFGLVKHNNIRLIDIKGKNVLLNKKRIIISKEKKTIPFHDLKIGDMFIHSGFNSLSLVLNIDTNRGEMRIFKIATLMYNCDLRKYQVSSWFYDRQIVNYKLFKNSKMNVTLPKKVNFVLDSMSYNIERNEKIA